MSEHLASLGYRMPAEWEKQSSTWVAWPHNKYDWPNKFKNIPKTFAKIISEISKVQRVDVLIQPSANKKEILEILAKEQSQIRNIFMYKVRTDRAWTRDFAPNFLVNNNLKKKLIPNFQFNAWAKYNNYKNDNQVKIKISEMKQIEIIDIVQKNKKIFLEGGAIDVNGIGSILLTKECLLSKIQQRNPTLNKKNLEKCLYETLGVKNFIWLHKGIVGDDTHGHIDDITRFFDINKIFTAVEKNKKDKNYAALKENLNILQKAKNIYGKKFEIFEIPMPDPIFIENTRVPASYLNFYFANKILLVPIFENKMDDKAIAVFEKKIKNRKIIPINCLDLIWGFGAIHCMTQQEPFI